MSVIESLDALNTSLCDGNATADDVLRAVEEANAADPRNVEILYRCARAKFDQHNTQPDNHVFREQCLREGLKYAEEALEVDDKHFGGHKWWAIMQGKMGNYLPMKEKIQGSFKIREHADIAATLNPDDATTKALLGEWCYTVANVSMVERTAASAIFASPPRATFAEAAQYFEEAVALQPYVHTLFMLGEVAKADGKKDVAAKWYQQAIDAKAFSASDEAEQETAKSRLAAVTAKGWFR